MFKRYMFLIAATTATAFGLSAHSACASLALNDILITDQSSIIRLDPISGSQSIISAGGYLDEPNGIAIDQNGELLVSEFMTRSIIRVNPNDGSQILVSSGGLIDEPLNIALEHNGNILITEFNNGQGRLIRIDPNDGSQTVVSSGFLEVMGLAVEEDGNILVGDIVAHQIIRVDPNDGTQTVVSSGGLLAEPYGIAIESDGQILVANHELYLENAAVIRVDPNDGSQTIVTSTGLFDEPMRLAIEANGDIVVTDETIQVVRVDPSNGSQSVVSSGGAIINPIGITVVTKLTFVSVEIDIKPGGEPNCFNANGQGIIPVAVLGDDTFDVSSIDQTTLSFGGANIRVRGNRGPFCGLEDVNSDGFNDIVCQFEDNPEYWEPGQDDATLTGKLLDGTSIEGTDSICIVP